MAFSTGGGRGKGLSDINVTPLVDVMLVLLIIFMVTAPLIQQGVKIDLPKTKAAQMDDKKHNLVLMIDKDGQIFLDDVNVPREQLEDMLKANKKVQDNEEVDIKADRNLPYGNVVDVMAKAQSAGVTNIGMVTDPGGTADPDNKPPPTKKKH
ncbi:MAG: protein TolR [Deltaproteobacteria bacterium]|nr:protein TolR [Deltaproteobacteria bacterium]